MVDVELLIELVKKNNILWDYRLRSYKDRKNKEILWHEIGVQLGKSVSRCKSKWKGLRDSFFREDTKRTSEGKLDLNDGWQYYQQLLFLKKVKTTRSDRKRCAMRTSSNGVDMGNEDNTYLQSLQDFPDPLEETQEEQLGTTATTFPPELTIAHFLSPQSPKKMKIDETFMDDNLSQNKCSINDFTQRAPKREDIDYEEDHLYCKLLIKKLQKFPLMQKNELKIELLRMLNDAEQSMFGQ